MNCGLYLHYFGLLNILSPVGCFIYGRGCKTCPKWGFFGPCIQQELMCDGYTDCLNGADERACGDSYKHCVVIRYIGQLKCTLRQHVIEVDDAWFDNYSKCIRKSRRQSVHSTASNICNNKNGCSVTFNGTQRVKILYHCKDKNAQPTRQTSKSLWNNTPMGTKLTSKITNDMYNNRTPQSTTRVTMPSLNHGKDTKENVSPHPATSTSTQLFTTSVERHAQESQKYSFKKNNTIFSTLTTNNRIHKTIGESNCNTTEKREKISSRQYTYIHFRDTTTVESDTISTVNNNQIPTHVMHINNTFMKHDSNTNNSKNKSQVPAIAGSLIGVVFVICLVLLMVAVRWHIIKRDISKDRERTTKSTSNNQSRECSNSFEGQNNIPLYSSVNKLTKSELGKTMPQSKSISNIGYMETCEFSVQNEDYDHIERIGRRADVEMVYSLTTYQKTEDDYDISGNFNESLRSYQENSIYD